MRRGCTPTSSTSAPPPGAAWEIGNKIGTIALHVSTPCSPRVHPVLPTCPPRALHLFTKCYTTASATPRHTLLPIRQVGRCAQTNISQSHQSRGRASASFLGSVCASFLGSVCASFLDSVCASFLDSVCAPFLGTSFLGTVCASFLGSVHASSLAVCALHSLEVCALQSLAV